MGFLSVKTGVMERMSYNDEPKYYQLESLGDAFDALRTRGSRMKQRIIAGSIISVLMIFAFFAVSHLSTAEASSHNILMLCSFLPMLQPHR